MDITDPFMFLTVELRVVYQVIFLPRQKCTMELTLLLIHKTFTLLIAQRNTRNGLTRSLENEAMPPMDLSIQYWILKITCVFFSRAKLLASYSPRPSGSNTSQSITL